MGIEHDRLKTYEEFMMDYEGGYYNGDVKLQTPLKTVVDFIENHKEHKKIFLSFFNLSFKKMINSKLWERE